jgi:asparagine synthase (glutamine-hydrolysing)
MCFEVDFSVPDPVLRRGGIELSATGPVRDGSPRDSPQVPPNPFIVVCSRLQLTLAGDIALHNRAHLLSDLRGGPDGDCAPCDGELVLAAYAKWGVRCPEFLLGEFSFAIWDSRERHLFCCRDQMGARPLFYFLDQAGVVFASDPRQILGLPRVPRKLNLEKLSALAFPGGLKQYPEETFHAGIHCLPPGSWIVVDQRGIRRQAYWQPEIREDLVPRRDEEVFEALGDLLKQAVESRVARTKTPAALLSGGLDSSSIVSLAGRFLAAKNGSLTAFAAILSDEMKLRIADEREYIDEFRGFPGVHIEYVTPGGGPFDSIEDTARFELTFMQSSRRYLYEALKAAALSRGADILLDGEGGEYGPTNWGSPYYAQLALTGRWPTLLREMNAVRRVAGGSPVRVLAGQLLRLAAPQRHSRPNLLLQSDFVRSTGVSSGVARKWPQWPDQRRQQKSELRDWLARAAIRVDVLGPCPRHSYPLLDKRVVEFCLAVPGNYKVRNGYRRYLIRKALDGILPPRIQWRTSKAPFSPDYFKRYNRQLRKVRDFVADIGVGDAIRSVVDVNALTELLQRPPVKDGDIEALGSIPTTVYLICFLRQFPEFRP